MFGFSLVMLETSEDTHFSHKLPNGLPERCMNNNNNKK